MMYRILHFCIVAYQCTLSPDHGLFRAFFPFGACRYQPTCSAYADEALRTHGVVKGGLLALRRLFHCHPWATGGIDPVPR